jgi:hypothetical protein
LSEHQTSSKSIVPREASRDRSPAIGDIRQWLGTGGDVFGTSGRLRRTFLYSFAAIAVIVGVVNRLLMRSPLTALETEFSPRGFLRAHRSWIVNAKHVTALRPEGSGDYSIELGSLSVPLSRRFPEALARLKERSV